MGRMFFAHSHRAAPATRFGYSFCAPREHAIVRAAPELGSRTFGVKRNSVEGDQMTIGRRASIAMIAAGLLAGGGSARAQDGKLTVMVFPGMQNLALFA